MKSVDYLLSTSTRPARKPRSFANLVLRQQSSYGKPRRNNTGKERDSETGLYYYGARYLDPKISRWISGDPAIGEYIPSAPVSEEAKKRNGSLPGMGGVFNYVNLHAYHYAGNNPVKYVDPDGRSPKDNITSMQLVDLGSGSLNKTIEGTRLKIAVFARSNIGSELWNTDRKREGVKEGVNKCNIFVYEMTSDAGADPGLPNSAGHIARYRGGSNAPPTAGQWADPDFVIPGWRVLSSDEKTMLGDVAAQRIDARDATGHTAIVTGDGKTTGTSSIDPSSVKETDWGFRDTQKDQVVFRRWEGIE